MDVMQHPSISEDSAEGIESDLEVAAVLSSGNQNDRYFGRSYGGAGGSLRNGGTISAPCGGGPSSRPGSSSTRNSTPSFSPYRPSTVISNAPRNNKMTVTPSAAPVMTIHQIAARGEVSNMKRLLENGQVDVNETDEFGLTPLMWASANDQVEMVFYLSKNGADCNACGNENETALHLAAVSGFDRTVKMLFSRGFSNINQRTLEGNTALLFAIHGNHIGCFKEILENGADFLQVNNKGHTALELALIMRHHDIELMLEEYIVKLMEST